MVEQQAPRPKKSRRYTAPPQTVSDSVVLGVFAMPHGAGRPDTSRPAAEPDAAKPDAAEPAPAAPDSAGANPSGSTAAAAKKPANAKTPGKTGAADVLPERAAEDDPRRWGDTEDDLGEWMKSQRPPHWD